MRLTPTSSSAHPVTGVLPVMPVAPFAGVSKDPNGAAVVAGALMSTHTSMYWGELSIPVPPICDRRAEKTGRGEDAAGVGEAHRDRGCPGGEAGVTTIHG